MGDAVAKDIAETLILYQGKERQNSLTKQFDEKKMTEQQKHKLNDIQEPKLKIYVANIRFVKLFEVADGGYQFDKDVRVTIKKILDLIRDGNNALQDRCKKGIVLFGYTGAGKSTLAHLLSGRKLHAIMDEEIGELVIDAVEPLKDIVIGHKPASETRIPNKCLVKNLTIWDCPGIDDTDLVQEIANSFYMKRLFEITEQLIFVLVVPEFILSSANARGSIFLETLSIFIKSFNDFESIKDSVSMIVTHVARSKTIQHIKKSMDKILTGNQGAADKHKALIKKLIDNDSIQLFYKPIEVGELPACNLLPKIEASSKYFDVKVDTVNITISKKAMDYSSHLLNIACSNFNKLLVIIVEAIGNATRCIHVDPRDVFSENYVCIEDWVPSSIYFNSLPKHDKDEYFLELNLQSKLQEVLNCDQMVSLTDGITLFQQIVEIFAEYADPGNVHLQHEIQGYGYCLKQQYEYVKFFATVCKAELPDHARIAELVTICHAKVTENIEYQVNNLAIDQNRSDLNYYTKAIKYLENYPDSPVCNKLKATACSCMGSIAEAKGAQKLALIYYVKAINANRQLPKIYEKLGLLLYKGEYNKAIDCYKVVNNEFKIKSCFKAWLKQDQENPDVMLNMAEYFESIGLFEQSKKYYHHAFSLSQDENFKAAALKKIGNIMVNTDKGQDFIRRAQEYDFYNFTMVNEELTQNLLGLVNTSSDLNAED